MQLRVLIPAVATLAVCFASSLEAQQRGGRGFGQFRASRTALLRIDAVQKELEVTEDQLADIEALPPAGPRGARGGGGQAAEDAQAGRGGRGGARCRWAT